MINLGWSSNYFFHFWRERRENERHLNPGSVYNRIDLTVLLHSTEMEEEEEIMLFCFKKEVENRREEKKKFHFD
jgi:hypothetical protein